MTAKYLRQRLSGPAVGDAPIARKERWPLRQHRQHRLRPYWAPAGVREQVDICRRKRDMPDLRAVVLSRLRIHYR